MGGAVANEHPAFVWQPPLPKYLACISGFVSYILQQGNLGVGKGKVTVARSCCGAVLGYCERPCIRATTANCDEWLQLYLPLVGTYSWSKSRDDQSGM